MNSDASGNGKETGGRVTSVSVPMVTIVFDPRTYSVDVQGNAPTLLFAKAMLQMAADELERQIVAQRNVSRIAQVSTDFMKTMKGGA